MTGRVVAAAAAVATVVAAAAGGCGVVLDDADASGRLQVVATTPIIADLVANVGGDDVSVHTLVPSGADPHTYEPSLRDVREVVYADVAFSNHLLLEQQAIVATIDANLRDGAAHVSLAEGSARYGAHLIALVEDRSLDTIWLGLRVHGDGADLGADRSSTVALAATALEGPGDVWAYVTESFGRPAVQFDSSDGFDAASGHRDDTATLPPAAHTHMSWAFSAPGVHHLSLSAALSVDDTSRPIQIGTAVVTFAVGVDPGRAGRPDATVLDGGHADIAVDLDTGELVLLHDPDGARHHEPHRIDPADAVIAVPNNALHEVPPDPQYRFLGRAGERIHQLPQAVLGRHVHGEVDPHLWHDVRNAIAYVQLIRDTLVDADPQHALDHRRRAQAYVERLERLDGEVQEIVSSIPTSRRHLITTHDAFGYLAHAYGLEVSGVVTPNPSTEPSLSARRRLADTITNLEVPAVFLEPNLIARSSTLVQLADDHDVEVCPLLGDTFHGDVRTYEEMMVANARSLQRCLGT